MRNILRGVGVACLCVAASAHAQSLFLNLNRQARPEGSNPRGFTELAPGVVLFIARHPTDGLALYRTDGTASGTSALAILSSTTDPSTSALRMVTGGGRAFFVAETRSSGVELWVSDGTSAGTRLLVDAEPGSSSGMHRSSGLATVGSTLSFEGPHDAGGLIRAFWQSDGTPQGTQRLTGPAVDSNGPFFSLGAELFFRGPFGPTATNRRLMKWNGASVLVVDPTVVSVQSLEVVNGRAWFSANPLFPDAGSMDLPAIFSTTGTGPFQRLPLASATRGATGDGFRALGNLVVFRGCPSFLNDAGMAETDCEPWATDGGHAWLLADIRSGGASGPSDFTPLGTGRALFTATSTGTTRDLWTTDGTPAGTALVRAFQQSTLLANAGSSRGVLWANDGTAPGLWVTDGTPGGTARVPGFGNPAFGTPDPFWPVGNEAWFGCATVGGNEPCRSDGTISGTSRFVNLLSDDLSSNPSSLASLPGEAWFLADAPFPGTWRTDGTDAGTALVTSDPGRAFHFRTPLLATTAGLSRLVDAGLEPLTPAPSVPPTSVARVRGGVVFRHESGSQPEVWFSDGTPEGSRAVLTGSLSIDRFAPFVTETGVGETPPALPIAYFVADDGTGQRVWRTDGTMAGTTPLSQSVPIDPLEVAVTSRLVIAVANTAATGTELLAIDRVDGGSTLIDLVPGSTGAVPFSLRAIGDTVFFAATTPAEGTELWRTDGTLAGTTLVGDVNPGAASGLDPMLGKTLSRVGAALYFAGSTDAGTEPWRSGGSLATTRQLSDVVPGPVGSLPGSFAVAPGRVLFAATDRSGDRELWSVVQDSTPPDAGLRVMGDAGTNGWFLSDVTVQFGWADPQGSVVTLGDCRGLTVDFDTAGFPFECVVESEGGRVAVGGLVKRDATPPRLVCPTLPPTEATSLAGATVAFTLSASDNLDGGARVTLSHDAGAFPLGSTNVRAQAVDEAGNTSACQFQVSVVDTRAPVLTCPALPVSVPAMSDAGAVVAFDVTAADLVDPSPTVTFSRDAGALFPLGQTLVTATAVDDSMNEASCTVTVVVGDEEAPTITCPSTPVVVAAESAAGSPTPSAFPQVQARDNVVSMPVVTFTRDTGQPLPSTLAVGQTITIRATASDGRFMASCVFDAVVRDVTPPTIRCPASFSLTATTTEGGLATWADPMATDAVDPSVAVRTSQPKGTLFPPGVTTVTATATDDANLEATCSFEVTVVPCEECGRALPVPVVRSQYSFGCSGLGSGPEWLGLVSLAGLARRASRSRRRGRARRARGGWWLGLLGLLVATGAWAGKPKLAVIGLKGATVDDGQARVLAESLQSELSALEFYEVIGGGDIAAMLGLERQRQLLGCEAGAECMAELAGALATERTVAGDVGKVGDTHVLNVSLMNALEGTVIQRVRREGSSVEALLRQLRGVAYELANADPLRAGLPKLVERSFGGFVVGLRGDVDLYGLGALPGVTAEWSSRWFGVSLTVLARNLPGARLEGRFYPVIVGPVRPFIGAGTTAFLTGVAVRGSAGVAVRVWRLQLGVDGAFEYFVNGEQRFRPIAALIGVDVGWVF